MRQKEISLNIRPLKPLDEDDQDDHVSSSAETPMRPDAFEIDDDEKIETFSRHLAQLPEVTDAYLTTGEYDYVIIAAVENTEDYEGFLRKRLLKFPGIRHARSTFCLRRLKRDPSPSL